MTSHQFLTVLMPFLASAGFVTLNEMGDKTQLLAMAFATRIRFIKVMAGVLIATLLNHGLAVAVGALLASVPGWTNWVRFAAAILFIVFGLWALKSDKSDEDESTKHKYGDVATVAIAFFIAEMGDKTQLATITLAAKYASVPLLVLAGTTTGMLIADGIGIVVGVLLHRKLPDQALKMFASIAFIIFGLSGLWEALRETFRLTAGTSATVVICVAALSAFIGVALYRSDRKERAA